MEKTTRLRIAGEAFVLLLALFVGYTMIGSCHKGDHSGLKKELSAIIDSTVVSHIGGGTDDVTTFKYEGCEYLYIQNGYAGIMSHKGNCSNPLHYQNIDLPNGVEFISTNIDKPDTLLAFKDNDIIYLSYKPKVKAR